MITANPPAPAPAPVAGTPRAPIRRRWLRRGPLELLACGVIGAGILMLLQPFFMLLYTWSFVTMLAGTVLFMLVSKLPQ